jgi:hypothetical protein
MFQGEPPWLQGKAQKIYNNLLGSRVSLQFFRVIIQGCRIGLLGSLLKDETELRQGEPLELQGEPSKLRSKLKGEPPWL